MQDPDLHGKTALVTGAGRGIGRATALALARCGASVVLVARSESEIHSAAEAIEREGGRARAIPCDIAHAEAVETLFASAGPIDILINNAGTVQPIAPVVGITRDEWRRNIAINLDGVFFACRAALPSMLAQGWGRIINVSSGAARGSVTGWSAYSASKAGVEALTKVLALEVGTDGVHVNAVRPGIVDTGMQSEIRSSPEDQFGSANLARFQGYQSRGLLRPPEHPARLLLWLLTEEAAEVNGEILAIDDPEIAARIGLEPMGR